MKIYHKTIAPKGLERKKEDAEKIVSFGGGWSKEPFKKQVDDTSGNKRSKKKSGEQGASTEAD